MAHQKIQVRGNTANLFSFVLSLSYKSGSTRKTASPFKSQPFRQVSDQFPTAISAAQNAHTQAVVLKVTKAIRMPLDQLHLTVKTFCDAVIPGKNGTFGPLLPANYAMPCPERATREGLFSKLINFI